MEKSIKGDVSFDPSNEVISKTSQTFTVTGPTGPLTLTRNWFCVGSNRYSYILGRQLDIDAQANEMQTQPDEPNGWYNYALLVDKLSSIGCPDPFNGSSRLTKDDAKEMLGDKMRLSNLSITQLPSPNDKLYTISIKIAYGDDEVLQDPSSTSPSCLSNPAYSKYCFVTDIKTVARKGLEP